jgi:hypothetical protein
MVQVDNVPGPASLSWPKMQPRLVFQFKGVEVQGKPSKLFDGLVVVPERTMVSPLGPAEDTSGSMYSSLVCMLRVPHALAEYVDENYAPTGAEEATKVQLPVVAMAAQDGAVRASFSLSFEVKKKGGSLAKGVLPPPSLLTSPTTSAAAPTIVQSWGSMCGTGNESTCVSMLHPMSPASRVEDTMAEDTDDPLRGTTVVTVLVRGVNRRMLGQQRREKNQRPEEVMSQGQGRLQAACGMFHGVEKAGQKQRQRRAWVTAEVLLIADAVDGDEELLVTEDSVLAVQLRLPSLGAIDEAAKSAAIAALAKAKKAVDGSQNGKELLPLPALPARCVMELRVPVTEQQLQQQQQAAEEESKQVQNVQNGNRRGVRRGPGQPMRRVTLELPFDYASADEKSLAEKQETGLPLQLQLVQPQQASTTGGTSVVIHVWGYKSHSTTLNPITPLHASLVLVPGAGAGAAEVKVALRVLTITPASGDGGMLAVELLLPPLPEKALAVLNSQLSQPSGAGGAGAGAGAISTVRAHVAVVAYDKPSSFRERQLFTATLDLGLAVDFFFAPHCANSRPNSNMGANSRPNTNMRTAWSPQLAHGMGWGHEWLGFCAQLGMQPQSKAGMEMMLAIAPPRVEDGSCTPAYCRPLGGKGEGLWRESDPLEVLSVMPSHAMAPATASARCDGSDQQCVASSSDPTSAFNTPATKVVVTMRGLPRQYRQRYLQRQQGTTSGTPTVDDVGLDEASRIEVWFGQVRGTVLSVHPHPQQKPNALTVLTVLTPQTQQGALLSGEVVCRVLDLGFGGAGSAGTPLGFFPFHFDNAIPAIANLTTVLRSSADAFNGNGTSGCHCSPIGVVLASMSSSNDDVEYQLLRLQRNPSVLRRRLRKSHAATRVWAHAGSVVSLSMLDLPPVASAEQLVIEISPPLAGLAIANSRATMATADSVKPGLDSLRSMRRLTTTSTVEATENFATKVRSRVVPTVKISDRENGRKKNAQAAKEAADAAGSNAEADFVFTEISFQVPELVTADGLLSAGEWGLFSERSGYHYSPQQRVEQQQAHAAHAEEDLEAPVAAAPGTMALRVTVRHLGLPNTMATSFDLIYRLPIRLLTAAFGSPNGWAEPVPAHIAAKPSPHPHPHPERFVTFRFDQEVDVSHFEQGRLHFPVHVSCDKIIAVDSMRALAYGKEGAEVRCWWMDAHTLVAQRPAFTVAEGGQAADNLQKGYLLRLQPQSVRPRGCWVACDAVGGTETEGECPAELSLAEDDAARTAALMLAQEHSDAHGHRTIEAKHEGGKVAAKEAAAAGAAQQQQQPVQEQGGPSATIAHARAPAEDEADDVAAVAGHMAHAPRVVVVDIAPTQHTLVLDATPSSGHGLSFEWQALQQSEHQRHLGNGSHWRDQLTRVLMAAQRRSHHRDNLHMGAATASSTGSGMVLELHLLEEDFVSSTQAQHGLLPPAKSAMIMSAMGVDPTDIDSTASTNCFGMRLVVTDSRGVQDSVVLLLHRQSMPRVPSVSQTPMLRLDGPSVVRAHWLLRTGASSDAGADAKPAVVPMTLRVWTEGGAHTRPALALAASAVPEETKESGAHAAQADGVQRVRRSVAEHAMAIMHTKGSATPTAAPRVVWELETGAVALGGGTAASPRKMLGEGAVLALEPGQLPMGRMSSVHVRTKNGMRKQDGVGGGGLSVHVWVPAPQLRVDMVSGGSKLWMGIAKGRHDAGATLGKVSARVALEGWTNCAGKSGAGGVEGVEVAVRWECEWWSEDAGVPVGCPLKLPAVERRKLRVRGYGCPMVHDEATLQLPLVTQKDLHEYAGRYSFKVVVTPVSDGGSGGGSGSGTVRAVTAEQQLTIAATDERAAGALDGASIRRLAQTVPLPGAAPVVQGGQAALVGSSGDVPSYRINPGELLLLKATRSNSTRSSSWTWTGVPAAWLVQPEGTAGGGEVLAIRVPHSRGGGSSSEGRKRLRVRAVAIGSGSSTSSDAVSVGAEVEVQINWEPELDGGACFVQPKAGLAWSTPFAVACTGWVDPDAASAGVGGRGTEWGSSMGIAGDAGESVMPTAVPEMQFALYYRRRRSAQSQQTSLEAGGDGEWGAWTIVRPAQRATLFADVLLPGPEVGAADDMGSMAEVQVQVRAMDVEGAVGLWSDTAYVANAHAMTPAQAQAKASALAKSAKGGEAAEVEAKAEDKAGKTKTRKRRSLFKKMLGKDKKKEKEEEKEEEKETQGKGKARRRRAQSQGKDLQEQEREQLEGVEQRVELERHYDSAVLSLTADHPSSRIGAQLARGEHAAAAETVGIAAALCAEHAALDDQYSYDSLHLPAPRGANASAPIRRRMLGDNKLDGLDGLTGLAGMAGMAGISNRRRLLGDGGMGSRLMAYLVQVADATVISAESGTLEQILSSFAQVTAVFGPTFTYVPDDGSSWGATNLLADGAPDLYIAYKFLNRLQDANAGSSMDTTVATKFMSIMSDLMSPEIVAKINTHTFWLASQDRLSVIYGEAEKAYINTRFQIVRGLLAQKVDDEIAVTLTSSTAGADVMTVQRCSITSRCHLADGSGAMKMAVIVPSTTAYLPFSPAYFSISAELMTRILDEEGETSTADTDATIASWSYATWALRSVYAAGMNGEFYTLLSPGSMGKPLNRTVTYGLLMAETGASEPIKMPFTSGTTFYGEPPALHVSYNSAGEKGVYPMCMYWGDNALMSGNSASGGGTGDEVESWWNDGLTMMDTGLATDSSFKGPISCHVEQLPVEYHLIYGNPPTPAPTPAPTSTPTAAPTVVPPMGIIHVNITFANPGFGQSDRDNFNMSLYATAVAKALRYNCPEGFGAECVDDPEDVEPLLLAAGAVAGEVGLTVYYQIEGQEWDLVEMVKEEIGWVDDGSGNYIETYPNEKLADFQSHVVSVFQTAGISMTRSMIQPDLEGLYVVYKPTPAPTAAPTPPPSPAPTPVPITPAAILYFNMTLVYETMDTFFITEQDAYREAVADLLLVPLVRRITLDVYDASVTGIGVGRQPAAGGTGVLMVMSIKFETVEAAMQAELEVRAAYFILDVIDRLRKCCGMVGIFAKEIILWPGSIYIYVVPVPPPEPECSPDVDRTGFVPYPQCIDRTCSGKSALLSLAECRSWQDLYDSLGGNDWGFCFNTEFVSFYRDPCSCQEPGHFIGCETITDAGSGNTSTHITQVYLPTQRMAGRMPALANFTRLNYLKLLGTLMQIHAQLLLALLDCFSHSVPSSCLSLFHSPQVTV